MFKKVKAVLFIFVVLLVLNKMGWLSEDAGKKVDGVSGFLQKKASEITYGGKKVGDMSLEELAGEIRGDVQDARGLVSLNKGKVLVQGDKFSIEVAPVEDEVVYAKISDKDEKGILALEGVIKKITGKDYSIRENIKDDGVTEIVLENQREKGFVLKVR